MRYSSERSHLCIHLSISDCQAKRSLPNVYQTLHGLHYQHEDERIVHKEIFECIKRGDEEKKYISQDVTYQRQLMSVNDFTIPPVRVKRCKKLFVLLNSSHVIGEMNPMDKTRQHHSELFTVRLWQEERGNNQVEWIGKVQHVSSGEALYFHDWPSLITFLLRWLPSTEEGPDAG